MQEKSLDARLDSIHQALDREHRLVMGTPQADYTRYRGYPLEAQKYLARAARKYLPASSVSFDLGCGIGAWTQFAAAAGLNSYGIDINDFLLSKARTLAEESKIRGDIPRDSVCKFALGNFHHGGNESQYIIHARSSKSDGIMPAIFRDNPYNKLGISLKDADVIYSFVWPEHSISLCTLLAQETKKSALFVLPLRLAECQSILPLRVLENVPGKGTALYRRS